MFSVTYRPQFILSFLKFHTVCTLNATEYATLKRLPVYCQVERANERGEPKQQADSVSGRSKGFVRFVEFQVADDLLGAVRELVNQLFSVWKGLLTRVVLGR